MSEELVEKLIETIETLSPKLWNILMRQVVFEYWTSTIGAILLIVIIIVSVYLARKRGWYLSYILPMPLILAILTLLYKVTNMWYNPEYYAIKILLENLK